MSLTSVQATKAMQPRQTAMSKGKCNMIL